MRPSKQGTSVILVTCVYLPLIFSLLAIFSTQLSPNTQDQLVVSLPQFLWVWLVLAVIMVVIIVVSAFSLKFNNDGNFGEASPEPSSSENTAIGDTNE